MRVWQEVAREWGAPFRYCWSMAGRHKRVRERGVVSQKGGVWSRAETRGGCLAERTGGRPVSIGRLDDGGGPCGNGAGGAGGVPQGQRGDLAARSPGRVRARHRAGSGVLFARAAGRGAVADGGGDGGAVQARAESRACPRRASCTHSTDDPRGLTVRPRAPHDARQRQTPTAVKAHDAARAGIEGAISQGVRVCDLRQAR